MKFIFSKNEKKIKKTKFSRVIAKKPVIEAWIGTLPQCPHLSHEVICIKQNENNYEFILGYRLNSLTKYFILLHRNIYIMSDDKTAFEATLDLVLFFRNAKPREICNYSGSRHQEDFTAFIQMCIENERSFKDE